MNNPNPPELQRMLSIWPELSEGMRFNILVLSGLSLLRNGKLKDGVAALGSGARFRAGLAFRDTREGLILAMQGFADLFRRQRQISG